MPSNRWRERFGAAAPASPSFLLLRRLPRLLVGFWLLAFLLVALPRERRRQIVAQHGEVDVARRAALSVVDCANQSSTGPASVDAKKYRYLPLRSNTGSLTSASPSVIGNDLSCSSEYAE